MRCRSGECEKEVRRTPGGQRAGAGTHPKASFILRAVEPQVFSFWCSSHTTRCWHSILVASNLR